MSLEPIIEKLRHLLGDNNQLFLAAVLGVLLVSCFIAYFITKRVILKVISYLAKRTKTDWDNVVIERGVFDQLAWLSPAVLLYFSVYPFEPETQNILQRLIIAWMIVVVIRTFSAFLSAVEDIYRAEDEERARRVPIKGYLQIIKLFVYLIGIVVVVSNVLGSSPWAFLSGIGAASAVLMLIFKDTILSFVASIQIALNDMMRIGDWISMPSANADGDVIDIALHIVRVQNFDKTITMIPTHKFIEQPFINWRGMQEAGGRRIKRSINIDQSTIRFLEQADLDKLEQFEILSEYIQEKRQALAEMNEQYGENETLNKRKLTNVGTFRAYMTAYVKRHPKVHKDMTLLIRQLAPTPQGLPLEIYTFTDEIRWAHYEGIQGDIFDHLLAVLPEFGLRVYQEPSGYDMRDLAAS